MGLGVEVVWAMGLVGFGGYRLRVSGLRLRLRWDRRLSALREQLRAAETRLDLQHGDWEARRGGRLRPFGARGGREPVRSGRCFVCVFLVGNPRLVCVSRSRGLQGECRRLQQLESAKLKRQVTPVT